MYKGALLDIVRVVVIVTVLVPVGLNLFEDDTLVAEDVTLEGLAIVVQAAAVSGLVELAGATITIFASLTTEFTMPARRLVTGSVTEVVGCGASTVVSTGSGTKTALQAPPSPVGAPLMPSERRERRSVDLSIIVVYIGNWSIEEGIH